MPLPDVVGWAIIDYIKNGRPNYYESNTVFIKHTPPFDPFADDNHLSSIIKKYMNKAGIKITKNHKVGFHSLRHSAASLMLESGTNYLLLLKFLDTLMSILLLYILKPILKNLRNAFFLYPLTMISSSIFNSVFSEEFQNLFEYKRALGFKYITEEGQFKQ